MKIAALALAVKLASWPGWNPPGGGIRQTVSMVHWAASCGLQSRPVLC